MCAHTHACSVSKRGSVPGVPALTTQPSRPTLPLPAFLYVSSPAQPLLASPALLNHHPPAFGLGWLSPKGVSPGSCFFKPPSPESGARAGPFPGPTGQGGPCGGTLQLSGLITPTYGPSGYPNRKSSHGLGSRRAEGCRKRLVKAGGTLPNLRITQAWTECPCCRPSSHQDC